MKTQHEIFPGYCFPKTNLQEVLLILIIQGHVSFFDFNYMQGFRARISNLTGKHGITLNTKYKTRRNKFRNTYTYAVHTLPLHEKDRAIELYKKLNKN